MLSVYYTEFIPVLVKAFQDQQNVSNSQKAELQATNNNHQSLLTRIESLETKASN